MHEAWHRLVCGSDPNLQEEQSSGMNLPSGATKTSTTSDDSDSSSSSSSSEDWSVSSDGNEDDDDTREGTTGGTRRRKKKLTRIEPEPIHGYRITKNGGRRIEYLIGDYDLAPAEREWHNARALMGAEWEDEIALF